MIQSGSCRKQIYLITSECVKVFWHWLNMGGVFSTAASVTLFSAILFASANLTGRSPFHQCPRSHWLCKFVLRGRASDTCCFEQRGTWPCILMSVQRLYLSTLQEIKQSRRMDSSWKEVAFRMTRGIQCNAARCSGGNRVGEGFWYKRRSSDAAWRGKEKPWQKILSPLYL